MIRRREYGNKWLSPVSNSYPGTPLKGLKRDIETFKSG
jgi:hypothetical protein